MDKGITDLESRTHQRKDCKKSTFLVDVNIILKKEDGQPTERPLEPGKKHARGIS